MKPRIFINIHYLEIGGAERALIGLLNAIDTNKVDVDLFINQHTGEFMPLIPKGINLLPENKRYATIEKPMVEVLRKGHIDIVAARIWAKIKHSHYIKSLQNKPADDASIFGYVGKYVTPLLPSLKNLGKYDLAISFLTPHNIVADKVDAKRKIAWIHTDYSKIHVDTNTELPLWNKFDNIISISPDVGDNFKKIFPTLSDKIIEIENILSPSSIRAEAIQGNAPEMDNYNGYKLLSIGRFSYAKNFESIPLIAKTLKEHGLKFKWYIIGYGDTSLTEEAINETLTNDCVILLGKKSNPYPYIQACDLYVQPSRYEGKAVTVREAQILAKPILITNYPTAASQIDNGVNGLICDQDNDKIAETILKIAQNKDISTKLISHLQQNDYGNEVEIEKIYKFIPNLE